MRRNGLGINMIDATRIAPKLYQGSYPVTALRPMFDVLVLCAKELQHRSPEPGLTIVHCPLEDDGSPMTRSEWYRAYTTSEVVARYLAGGKRVLVTCAAGRNRSGLVCALTLYRLTALDGEQCIQQIQARRRDALQNDFFVAALRALPPKLTQVTNPARRALHRIGPVHQRIGVD